MNRKLWILALSTVLSAALLTTAACKKKEESPAPEATTTAAPEPAPAAPTPSATATLAGNTYADVKGTVTFTQTPEGIKVVADLAGVDAAGKHGFHIHEGTECVGDFKSAGGHFNPSASALHAIPPTTPRHNGDLGNFEFAQGSGHLEIVTTDLSLDGANSVVGHAVILHAKEDDGKTQPTGNAGDRIACGIVTLDGAAAPTTATTTAAPAATTPQ